MNHRERRVVGKVRIITTLQTHNDIPIKIKILKDIPGLNLNDIPAGYGIVSGLYLAATVRFM